MKSKAQKRKEALIRAEKYTYDNSRAKRKGKDQRAWAERQAEIRYNTEAKV